MRLLFAAHVHVSGPGIGGVHELHVAARAVHFALAEVLVDDMAVHIALPDGVFAADALVVAFRDHSVALLDHSALGLLLVTPPFVDGLVAGSIRILAFILG